MADPRYSEGQPECDHHQGGKRGKFNMRTFQKAGSRRGLVAAGVGRHPAGTAKEKKNLNQTGVGEGTKRTENKNDRACE